MRGIGGKATFVTGVGDRPFPGTYITNYLVLHNLGEQGLQDLWSGRGRIKWSDPSVQDVLNYHRSFVRMKAYPSSITSMKLGEAHLYFYAEQKACMVPVGSWYDIGALWVSNLGSMSGIKTDISKVRSEHIDYLKTYLELNGRVKLVDLDWQVAMKLGMRDANIQVINTAFSAGLISVQEATRDTGESASERSVMAHAGSISRASTHKASVP